MVFLLFFFWGGRGNYIQNPVGYDFSPAKKSVRVWGVWVGVLGCGVGGGGVTIFWTFRGTK